LDTIAPLYIARIEVQKLFGLYDYLLEETASGDQAGRVAILYGDNGSGKTTILRSIFHILAPDGSAGHKTTIATTPFSFFKITLSDKTIIQVERKKNNLTGSFVLTIKKYRKKAESFRFNVNERMAINSSTQTVKERDEIALCLSRLKALNLGLYHLADDRTIELAGQASKFSSDSESECESDREQDYFLAAAAAARCQGYSGRAIKRFPARPNAIAADLLDQSMERFALWVKNLVLQASTAGDSNVNTLYNTILARVAHVSPNTLKKSLDKTQLQLRIQSVENRSRALAKYGFAPEFKGSEILAQLDIAAAPQNVSMMAHVLTPYLDSLEKRLEALDHVYEIVDNLVQIINGFLSHKEIEFHVHGGLSIVTSGGDNLKPSMLSSGERHLLLIFCNTAVSLDHPSIFIVDEPEISLNIKWQRSLIESLSKCIGSNPVQYIFATHSLEIISQYGDRVFKLGNKATHKTV